MLPFPISWVNFIYTPLYACYKQKSTLASMTRVCFYIIYGPISLIMLTLFVAVNLILFPFAYLKTIVHKARLVGRYRSQIHCGRLLLYIVAGIPLLLASQFVDAYYFILHSYSWKQRQQVDQPSRPYRCTLDDFNMLREFLDKRVLHEGVKRVNASKTVKNMRNNFHSLQHITFYLFGLTSGEAGKEILNSARERNDSLATNDEIERQRLISLRSIKAFAMFKTNLWNCALPSQNMDEDGELLPRGEWSTDLELMRDLL